MEKINDDRLQSSRQSQAQQPAAMPEQERRLTDIIAMAGAAFQGATLGEVAAETCSEKLMAAVELMARTGLFFSNADGIYQERERRFITSLITAFEPLKDGFREAERGLSTTLERKYTLDDIVSGTRNLLFGLGPTERRELIQAIEEFIRGVIKVDGHVHPLEHANYRRWKQAFGVV